MRSTRRVTNRNSGSADKGSPLGASQKWRSHNVRFRVKVWDVSTVGIARALQHAPVAGSSTAVIRSQEVSAGLTLLPLCAGLARSRLWMAASASVRWRLTVVRIACLSRLRIASKMS